MNIRIQEEQHLLYFAGEKDGQSPLGWMDKNWTAPSAAKHPIGNTICSAVEGNLQSVCLTALGLLAYPFVNTSIRNSIISTGASVCVPCGINSASLLQMMFKISEFSKEYRAAHLFDRAAYSFASPFVSAGSGITVGANCLFEPETLYNCRFVNYSAGVLNTVQDNFIPIAIATAGLGLGLSYLSKKSYEENEINAENKLISKLEDVYQKAADKLSQRNSYQQEKEMYELAGKILNRQAEIEEEVSSLELPSLTTRKIKDLTKPLFDVATQVRSRNMA